ncbi:MAG TPA: hypothetical protein VMS93_05540 [Candidatus Saccharimonadales bacterium]|nr:hypothetical protein [Candidatus Saccharimonadales bacterium]
MTRRQILPRPVRPAVAGFLLLTALAVACGFARRAGLLDAATGRRALGVLVGLMAMVTGNFLPKMRPLGAMGGDTGAVAAAERAAGWILVLLGVAYAALFALAPLDLAESLSPFVALGGIGLIAVDWIRVALRPRSRAREGAGTAPTAGQSGAERRTLAAWLLFALAYVVVAASLKVLSEGRPWARELASWSVIGFTIAYSLLYAVFDFRKRAR